MKHGCRLALVTSLLLACMALGASAPPPGRSEPDLAPAAPVDVGLARAQREIAAREYRASRNERGLQAPNRAHALRTWFQPSGIRLHDRIASGSPRLAELRLAGVGRSGARLAPVGPGTVVNDAARVEIRRPGLVEWYVNAPAGLEQGFTLARRPPGAGALVLELEVAGAETRLDGGAVVLASTTGRRLRYGKLEVWDAAGATQEARLEVPSTSLVRLVVDDADAAYPLVIDPLITGFASAVLESLSAPVVAGSGDVNGDGYDDVIVGVPYYDAGQSSEGAAFVFIGSATGIASGNPATAAAQLESDLAYAYFGWSVAGAGDVNGDGYDDVIVGAFLYANEGAAFVFLGSAAGIADGSPTTAAAHLESDLAYANFGSSVAGAGDVNGDGYDDVIVGAPRYATVGTDDGAAFVFLGSAAGIADGNPATAAARLESDLAYGTLGSSVAGAGDVNGDGFDDVIVGAPSYYYYVSRGGAAFLFHGSPAGIADGTPRTAATVLLSNEEDAGFGLSVAGAGDVNADGYDDVIVGAPWYAQGKGAAFVCHGAPYVAYCASNEAATRLRSDQANGLGWSVAGAGDVNGDGYDDVLVSAPSFTGSGAVLAFLGSATGVASGLPHTAAAQLQLTEPSNAWPLGSSVASAGDVNGDGYDDVIVSADSIGAAFVFLARTCSNGVDDDGDGLTDYPADVGCGSAADLSELGVVCSNGLDDDGDGLADHPADPGCRNPRDLWERGTTTCDNDLDDDGDGRVDASADPGCTGPADSSELGPAACDNGIDDDGDGRTDRFDPGCDDLVDLSELGSAACDNGIDDDGDGRVDVPDDVGCQDPTSSTENPRCQDGIDNDGYPGIDFDGGASVNGGIPIDVADPECARPWDREARYVEREGSGCGGGLGGFGAALLPLLVAALRRGDR